MLQLFSQRHSFMKFPSIRCMKSSRVSYCLACLVSLIEQVTSFFFLFDALTVLNYFALESFFFSINIYLVHRCRWWIFLLSRTFGLFYVQKGSFILFQPLFKLTFQFIPIWWFSFVVCSSFIDKISSVPKLARRMGVVPGSPVFYICIWET